MIRINKTASAPQKLTDEGSDLKDALQRDYAADPLLYTSRAGVGNNSLTKMPFDTSVYGDQTVKDLLISDQNEKCCFCEAKFLDNSYGDVEHFRPKGAYKKAGANKLTYPGYYWLAYEWSNLMFSCEKCNRSFKKNVFPLSNENTRKPFHNHPNALEDEENLLIDPSAEDPRDHIVFNEEVPIAVNGSNKGTKSIEAYGLERMNNTRIEYLVMLDLALTCSQIDIHDDEELQAAMRAFKCSRNEVIAKINDSLRLANTAAKDSAKFASCVRSKFPHLPTV